MPRLAFTALSMLLAAAFAGAVLFLWFSAGLPDLSSKEAIRAGLTPSVESQRQAAMGAKARGPKFELPALADVPPALISGVLAAESCPEALASPKESHFAFSRRVLSNLASGRGGAPGPGRCHLRFAQQVVQTFGIVDPVRSSIATYRVFSALSVVDLLALRLATAYFAPGVIGYSQASLALFRKGPSQLDLSQAAELVIAESRYPEVSTCKNPLQLRRVRDDLLNRLQAFGLAAEKDVAAAKLRPMSCTLNPFFPPANRGGKNPE
jgi:membrane carboxypeptidase/penicillin-binding protein